MAHVVRMQHYDRAFSAVRRSPAISGTDFHIYLIDAHHQREPIRVRFQASSYIVDIVEAISRTFGCCPGDVQLLSIQCGERRSLSYQLLNARWFTKDASDLELVEPAYLAYFIEE